MDLLIITIVTYLVALSLNLYIFRNRVLDSTDKWMIYAPIINVVFSVYFGFYIIYRKIRYKK